MGAAQPDDPAAAVGFDARLKSSALMAVAAFSAGTLSEVGASLSVVLAVAFSWFGVASLASVFWARSAA